MPLFPAAIVRGPLLGGSLDCLERGLSFTVRLCDLRPAVIPKGVVGGAAITGRSRATAASSS
jgi:hypothetical protein